MLTRLHGVADRTLAVAARNAHATRHTRYRWGLISGFMEPLLYLLSIGVGVGTLVGKFTVNGISVPYPAYVAPAMLASSAMSGAIAETSFRLYSKLRYQHVYDAMLATPVTPFEVILGELFWAVTRSVVYCAIFLGIMIGFGLTTIGWALVALPATALIGFAFGALGSMLATFMRDWKDFDYLGILLFTMFLFSGTFGPLASYPVPVRVIVQVLPLSHAVALLRGITTGAVSGGLVVHVGYLVLLTLAGLVTSRARMSKLLLN